MAENDRVGILEPWLGYVFESHAVPASSSIDIGPIKTLRGEMGTFTSNPHLARGTCLGGRVQVYVQEDAGGIFNVDLLGDLEDSHLAGTIAGMASIASAAGVSSWTYTGQVVLPNLTLRITDTSGFGVNVSGWIRVLPGS